MEYKDKIIRRDVREKIKAMNKYTADLLASDMVTAREARSLNVIAKSIKTILDNFDKQEDHFNLH